MTPETETEIQEPLNVKKTSTEELKKTQLTSENTTAITRELLLRDEKVMLKISSTERDKGGVTVILNSYAYNIPRDTWCQVPYAILEILDNASITEYTIKLDSKNSDHAEVETAIVSRFSMSTKPMEPPAKAEVSVKV